MKVIDSTFITDLINSVEQTQKVISQKDILLTTQINMYEVMRGIFYRGHSCNKIFAVQELFENMRVLPMNEDSIIKSAEIFAALRKKGQIISDCDCLTAGIALSHGIKTIITRNIKDFKRIKGINVESY